MNQQHAQYDVLPGITLLAFRTIINVLAYSNTHLILAYLVSPRRLETLHYHQQDPRKGNKP